MDYICAMDDYSDLILLLITAGTQGIMVFAGWIILRFPPGQPNAWYGYRTPRSMKNPEHWRDGNRFAAILMIRLGLWAMFISVLFYLIGASETVWMIWILGSVIAIAVIVVVRTESYLKDKYGK